MSAAILPGVRVSVWSHRMLRNRASRRSAWARCLGHCRRAWCNACGVARKCNALAFEQHRRFLATSAAEPVLSYELDRLFRPARRAAANVDLSQERAEAGRILLTSSSHSGMSTEDRAYLAQLVAANTGLAGPEAERRVDTVIASSQSAIAKSRRSSVILAFSVAAALLLGAVIAWAAAEFGGRHRDGAPLPSLDADARARRYTGAEAHRQSRRGDPRWQTSRRLMPMPSSYRAPHVRLGPWRLMA